MILPHPAGHAKSQLRAYAPSSEAAQPQLLAGLGLAAPADDPVTVTLLADKVRHQAAPGLTLGSAVAAGIGRWQGRP